MTTKDQQITGRKARILEQNKRQADRLVERSSRRAEELLWATGAVRRISSPRPEPWVKAAILRIVQHESGRETRGANAGGMPSASAHSGGPRSNRRAVAAMPLDPADFKAKLEVPKLLVHRHKIAGAAATANEASAEDEIAQQVLQLLWLFWEEVARARNRRDTYQWLTDYVGVRCSFALFEKLCAEIGYHPETPTRLRKVRLKRRTR